MPGVEDPKKENLVDDNDEASVLESVIKAGDDISPSQEEVVEQPKSEQLKEEVVEQPKPEQPKVESLPTQEDWKKKHEDLQKDFDSFRAQVFKPANEAPNQPQWIPKGSVKPEDLDKLYAGGEETVKFLNGLLDDVREDMAYLFLQYVDNEIVGKQLAPIQQQRAETERKTRETEFFTKFADLKPYEEIAQQVSVQVENDFRAGKLKLNTWDDAFNEIAKRTKHYIEIFDKAKGKSSNVPPPPDDAPKNSVKDKNRKFDLDNDADAIAAL